MTAPAFAFQTVWQGSRAAAPRWLAWVVTALAVFFTVYHVYTAVYGSPTTFLYLGIHLLTALLLVFLWFPLGRQWHEPFNLYSLVDLACVAATVAILVYMLRTLNEWELRAITMGALDYTMSIALIALVLEAVRRTVGLLLVLLILCFMGYALCADWFPDPFFGPPVPLQRLVSSLVYGTGGLFGIPLGVMADYVYLYILFGVMLEACGAGALFNNLGMAAFGHRQGGAAKAAVASSALQGMISGSALSNVLVSGAFTIPMMKRLGYRPSFAAAVEATSSNGGIITPPIMGAAAFMMAEFTGISYGDIALGAAIPAFLYYFVIYWTVHFEARRLNLRTIDRKSIPSLGSLVRRDGYLLLPLVFVTALLIADYSIAWVAIGGTLICFALAFLRAGTRMTPMRLVYGMEEAVRSTVGLSATCAGVGIIIGVVDTTGLNFQLSQLAISVAGGKLWLMLLIAAAMATVLGMGLSASAVYITLIATVIPILTQSGVPLMASHLFAIYFGIAANITPPVALAAYAAAPLAGANPFTTGLQAVRLGIGLFLLPFMFVYGPALVLIGSPLEILATTASAALGLWAIALGSVGYLSMPIPLAGRAMLIVGAICLVVPELISSLVGSVLVALPVAWVYWKRPRTAGDRAAPASLSEGMLIDLGTKMSGAPDEVAPWSLWAAWAIVVVATVGIAAMGEYAFHARQALPWLGLTALACAATVLAMSLVLKARRSA